MIRPSAGTENTAISDRLIETTVELTSLAPSGRLKARHASRHGGRSFPERRWRHRRRSRWRRSAPSATSVQAVAQQINRPKGPDDRHRQATAGIKVARMLRRNRKTTTVTRPTAISKVISVSCRLPRSSRCGRSRPSGPCRWQRLDQLRDGRLYAVQVEMMFAPGGGQDDDASPACIGQAGIAQVSTSPELGHIAEAHRGPVAIGDDAPVVRSRRPGRWCRAGSAPRRLRGALRAIGIAMPARRARPPARCRI